jgi:hypothetical protein
MVCQLQVVSGTLTNIVSNQSWSAAAGNGCTIDTANSFPLTYYIDSSNVAHLRNGNLDAATFNSTGTWTIGSSANSTVATFQKSAATVLGFYTGTTTANSNSVVQGTSWNTTNGACFEAKATGSAANYTFWYFTAGGGAPVYTSTSCSGAATTTVIFD